MSKRNWNILVAATVIAILMVLATVLGFAKNEPLEVGQVWETPPSGDPFKSRAPARRKITALEYGGAGRQLYVQYERVDEDVKGAIGSLREEIFRAGDTKLIEEPPDEIEEPVEDPNIIWLDLPIESTLVDSPPVWGKGELPADHQDFFGDGNNSRLNYVQNRVLDKHARLLRLISMRILVLEGADPNSFQPAITESVDPNGVGPDKTETSVGG